MTVDDGELARHLETLPVGGGLGDIVTDLLWRQTERTDLGGERRGSTGLTSDGSQVNNGDCVRIWRSFGGLFGQVFRLFS